MPTRVTIFLIAIASIVAFIIIGIIITVLITGKFAADKNEKENKRRWLFLKAKDKKDKKEEANQ